MKLLRIFLHSLFFLLLAYEPALAGPVAVAIGAFFSAVASTAIGQIVIGIALSVASSLLQRAMMKDPEAPPVPGVSGQVTVGGDNPISFVVGTYATMGQREYVNTCGRPENDGVPNIYLVDVISLGDIPFTSLESVVVDGTVCTLLPGEVDADGFIPIDEFRDKSGDANRLWVKFYDGTQTTADPWLLDRFGSHPDRPWESDMIGRGVPYGIMRARLDTELFSGFPKVTWVVKGIKLYDIRKDSTAGGSGSHRWDNQATYEYTDNAFVIAYNILRGIKYGTQWMYGLQNMSALRLPAASWMAAMNEADRAIPLAGGGTEKQFRVGAEIFGDNEAIEILNELMKSSNGRLAENGGVYKPLCGVAGGSVYSFSDEDIVISEPQTFDPAPGLEDTENGMHATYPEPEEGWQSKDAPPYYRIDYEQDDDDRRLLAKADFPMVPYAVQVQRLMRTIIDESRRFRKHQFVMPPECWLFEPNDVVSYNSERNGYIDKKFLITGMDDGDDVLQTMQIQELDPTDYDWSTDFELPYFIAVTTPVRTDPQVMNGWTATASSVTDDGGFSRRPAILVGWDITQEETIGVEIEIRVKLTGAVVYNGSTRNFLAGSALIANNAILPLTQYEVRGKYIPKVETRSADWSSWLTVTTLNLLITADDILAGAIHELQLADRAVTNLKIALLALDETLIQNNAIITRTIADLAVNEAKVANNAISVNKIVNGAVVNGKLADNAVTTAKINDAAIIAAKIFDGAVNTNKLANDAVTTLKLAPLAVEAGNIASNAITSTKITDGAILTPKLAAGAVVADKIAANAILASKLIIGDYSNMYPDYDMADPDFYVGGGTGNSYTIVPTAHPLLGQNYINIALSSGVNTFVATDWMALEETTDYIVKVHAWRAAAGGVYTVYYQLGELDGSGNIINVTTHTIISSATASSPTEYSINLASGDLSNKKRIRILAYNMGASGSTQDVRFGGIIMRRRITPEIIVDGAITTDKISANAVSADKIAAGAVTAKHMVVADFTNLITDPYFEDSNAWQSKPNPPFTFGTTAAAGYNSANTYLNVADGTGSLYQYGYQTKCVPGDAFRLVGIGKKVNATAGKMRMYLQFRDASSAALATHIQEWDTADSTSYVGKVAEGVAPADTTHVVAVIDTAGTAVTNFYRMGFFGLYRRATATLIVDGAITADKIAANQISAVHIVALSITGAEIAASAITSTKINAGSVLAGNIGTNAVTAVKINAGAITTEKLDVGAVTANEIGAGAVTAVKIATGAVTAIKLTTASAVITESLQIGNVIIDTNHLIGGSVSAAGSVFASADLSVGNLTWTQVAAVTITPNNGTVQLIFTGYSDGSGKQDYQIRFKRNTTVINTTNGTFPVTSISTTGTNPINTLSYVKAGGIAHAFVDTTPGTSSVTYRVEMLMSVANDNIDDRFLSVLNLKK